MADETPPDSPRPPVRMGLRVVARHSAGRHGGRALAREVAESHRPKHLDAATRLSRSASTAPPPPPAPPSFGAVRAAAPAAAAAPAGPGRRGHGLHAPGLGADEHERLRRAVDVRRPAGRELGPGLDGPGREDARAVEGAARRALHRPRRPGALARRPHRRGRRHRRARQRRGARHLPHAGGGEEPATPRRLSTRPPAEAPASVARTPADAPSRGRPLPTRARRRARRSRARRPPTCRRVVPRPSPARPRPIRENRSIGRRHKRSQDIGPGIFTHRALAQDSRVGPC